MNVVEVKRRFDRFDLVRHLIGTAFESGFDISDPEAQIPPFIRLGVEFLEDHKELTIEDISDAQIENWKTGGGADHPDPTLRSMG